MVDAEILRDFAKNMREMLNGIISDTLRSSIEKAIAESEMAADILDDYNKLNGDK